jgi:riboflavin-specific deaminase-like protein
MRSKIPTVISSAPITFKRLLPPDDPAGTREILAGLGLRERSSGAPARGPAGASPGAPDAGRTRPYVVLNMVSTLDGRATLQGRSGPLSDPADRALFHGLRSVVDAVMAGAGTVRAERYGPIVPDPDTRRLRSEQGLRERPLACVVSASLAFPPDLPLLADPDSQVAILTSSRESLPETAAQVEYVRAGREDGSLALDMALAELHDRLHVRTLLCEGGPHLNTELLSAGLVDELFLSISPLLAGGDPADGGPTLRILAGTDLQPPARLELISALERDSRLFLRYRVLDRG